MNTMKKLISALLLLVVSSNGFAQVECETLEAKSWDQALGQLQSMKLSHKLTPNSAALFKLLSENTHLKENDETLEGFVRGLEAGLMLTPEKRNLQKSISLWRKNLNCTKGSPALITLGAERNSLYGAQRLMSIAYQSCSVTKGRALDTTDPLIKGVKITGYHPDGIGYRRIIEDLGALQATHPYVAGVEYGPSCRQIRSNPLIYDYGGKPETSTGAFDLFSNAGDGTSVLGIDCSGYVFAALGAAGLKISSENAMRASQVHGIPARAYLNPAANGMNCFNRVSFNSAGEGLALGDIMVSRGHIVFVGAMNEDPFAIAGAKSNADCDALDPYAIRLSFYHSSPVRGGVGIAFSTARELLPESDSFRPGLSALQKQLCKAKVAGVSVTPSVTGFSVIRHKGTAACRTTPLAVRGEACVNGCYPK